MAKAKKKNKKRSGPPQALVRLSQVMIVKNEERNIEKALSWAKGIAFEQIVVDTGSTDGTVELAKKLGARVEYFEWINDFGAAKNYAIEQASGNWIAFLDADEYFNPPDVKKLMQILKFIQSNPEERAKWDVINCPWANVNEEGKVYSVYEQERIFKNIPSIRYVGRIHEYLSTSVERIYRAADISIVHTGYTDTSLAETQKAQRNIDLLRIEQKERPDDGNVMRYLADAIKALGGEDNYTEAMKLYEQALIPEHNAAPGMRRDSYESLMQLYLHKKVDLDKTEALCRAGLDEFNGDMDFEYYLGMTLNRKGEYNEALRVLKSAEDKLLNSKAIDEGAVITAKPMKLFSEMFLVAHNLKDSEAIIRYGIMVLAEDKRKLAILAQFMLTLGQNGVPDDEIIKILSNVYDMNRQGDLLLIARVAKEVKAYEFAKRILEMAQAIAPLDIPEDALTPTNQESNAESNA